MSNGWIMIAFLSHLNFKSYVHLNKCRGIDLKPAVEIQFLCEI